MSEEGYNGWKNRETWALVLHLSATESIYSDVGNAIRLNVRNRFYIEDVLFETEEALEAWIEDVKQSVFETRNATADESRMIEDVGSFYRVDWREVASYCIEEYLGGLERYISKYPKEA